jgi:phosphate starvation-inducible membrane PsiE
LREVEAPTFSDIRITDGGKVVSPTRRAILMGKIYNLKIFLFLTLTKEFYVYYKIMTEINSESAYYFSVGRILLFYLLLSLV